MRKRPFDIDFAMERIRGAVRPFRKAAMFELADEGFVSTFEQLIACMVSIRTRDEVTVVCARRLFELARTAEAMSRLTPRQIDTAIGASTFHEPKARQILEISRRIVAEHNGELPCDYEVLISFPGVGPKFQPLKSSGLSEASMRPARCRYPSTACSTWFQGRNALGFLT